MFLYTYYIYRCKNTLLRPIDGAGFQRKACGAIYVQEMALCVKQKPSKRSFDMNV
jgi:hypothetical protein